MGASASLGYMLPNQGHQRQVQVMTSYPTHICWFVVEVAIAKHESEVLHTLLGGMVDILFQLLLDGTHVHRPFHNSKVILKCVLGLIGKDNSCSFMQSNDVCSDFLTDHVTFV